MSNRCQLCGQSFSFNSSLVDHLEYTHRLTRTNARQMAERNRSSSSYGYSATRDAVDSLIDVGVGMAVGAALGSIFDSSSSDSGWSGGGGESGGGGASGDW